MDTETANQVSSYSPGRSGAGIPEGNEREPGNGLFGRYEYGNGTPLERILNATKTILKHFNNSGTTKHPAEERGQ